LRKYERWRKGDNLGMMMLMDGFKRVFGVRFTPFRILRNAGLRLTDVLPPVKSLIMKNAMGVRGELPDLARPGSLE
jgi:2-octaprenylphenol hydroxylase